MRGPLSTRSWLRLPWLSAGLGLALVLGVATTAGAQAVDQRWNDWLGCWDLVADGNVARLPPAETAADGITGPIRPGSSRDARICVSPAPGGAELRTLVGEQQVLSQTIVADGADHQVADGGCTGTQRAQWSADGLRLFTRAQVTCEGQPARTVTGLTLMSPDGQWVDVQAVTIGATDSVRVRRFRPSADRVLAGLPMAAVRLQIEHVKEASKHVSSRAIEAALMETSARFPLSSRVLVDLDKAGVDDRVIDLMVALSYPRSFSVQPSGPADRLTPFPPIYGGADFVDASYDSPFFGPFYSNYYYSPYFFSPFGYSYLRYYPYYAYYPYYPVYYPPDGSGGGDLDGGDHRPPENGRAVNGRGYTRVDRRDDGGGSGGPAPTPRSDGSSGATVSKRGYTAGDTASSASAPSSSGSSGSSSGSSSSSPSSGGGDGGGRSAVPR